MSLCSLLMLFPLAKRSFPHLFLFSLPNTYSSSRLILNIHFSKKISMPPHWGKVYKSGSRLQISSVYAASINCSSHHKALVICWSIFCFKNRLSVGKELYLMYLYIPSRAQCLAHASCSIVFVNWLMWWELVNLRLCSWLQPNYSILNWIALYPFCLGYF